MAHAPSKHTAAQARRLIEVIAALDGEILRGRPADTLLADLFKSNRSYGSHDRRLIADTAFSFFRWRGWVFQGDKPDYAKAIALAHALDAEIIHPVAAHLAAESGDSIALTPCGDLSLDRKATCVAMALGLDTVPDIRQLVPDWAITMVDLPEDIVLRCIASYQSRPPTWLRFVKGRRDAGIPALSKLGYVVDPHPRLQDTASTVKPISRAHRRPTWEIQDLASQCVGLVAQPRPGESWWDLCAGGGGKSLHLADLMNGEGAIRATEKRKSAAEELVRRAKDANLNSMIRVSNRDGRDFPHDHLFDGVLIDAPCSGMGTWSRSPDARWRMSAERVRTLADVQKELLAHGAQCVRPGAALVYSVCTLTAPETTEQADIFQRAHPDFEPATFPHPLTGEPIQGHTWIYPWDGPCGAMFIAKWRKRGNI